MSATTQSLACSSCTANGAVDCSHIPTMQKPSEPGILYMQNAACCAHDASHRLASSTFQLTSYLEHQPWSSMCPKLVLSMACCIVQ